MAILNSNANCFPTLSLVFVNRFAQGKIVAMKIRPARRINGRVCPSGDKSISHRAAIIAALAEGTSQLSNFSPGADCASTLSCLEQLGVSIIRAGETLRVGGVGLTGWRAPTAPLDCGNSGSTMRMLAGVLAGQGFTSALTGDASLRARPMKRIIEPLQMMGAELQSQDGKPPLTIKGRRPLKSIRYELPVASAQVKTSVLLAGLHAEGHTEVIETSGATRNHTERMLKWFGVPVETKTDAGGFTATSIAGSSSFKARDVSIPGDISSAAFLIAAAALLPNSNLEIERVGLNPTRTQFLEVLRLLGFGLEMIEAQQESNEPRGTVRVSGSYNANRISLGHPHSITSPATTHLIDELPLLAIIGTQLSGGIEIRDAQELRLKESDRIRATVKNLRAMGAEVEEFDDGLAVAGPCSLRGAKMDSFRDHRIAMAFTVAALIAEGDSEISGAECVDISFPNFFELLESIVER
jgi:3-phosphoshikimate 1-carboxyvinyltransferase